MQTRLPGLPLLASAGARHWHRRGCAGGVCRRVAGCPPTAATAVTTVCSSSHMRRAAVVAATAATAASAAALRVAKRQRSDNMHSHPPYTNSDSSGNVGTSPDKHTAGPHGERGSLLPPPPPPPAFTAPGDALSMERAHEVVTRLARSRAVPGAVGVFAARALKKFTPIEILPAAAAAGAAGATDATAKTTTTATNTGALPSSSSLQSGEGSTHSDRGQADAAPRSVFAAPAPPLVLNLVQTPRGRVSLRTFLALRAQFSSDRYLHVATEAGWYLVTPSVGAGGDNAADPRGVRAWLRRHHRRYLQPVTADDEGSGIRVGSGGSGAGVSDDVLHGGGGDSDSDADDVVVSDGPADSTGSRRREMFARLAEAEARAAAEEEQEWRALEREVAREAREADRRRRRGDNENDDEEDDDDTDDEESEEDTTNTEHHQQHQRQQQQQKQQRPRRFRLRRPPPVIPERHLFELNDGVPWALPPADDLADPRYWRHHRQRMRAYVSRNHLRPEDEEAVVRDALEGVPRQPPPAAFLSPAHKAGYRADAAAAANNDTSATPPTTAGAAVHAATPPQQQQQQQSVIAGASAATTVAAVPPSPPSSSVETERERLARAEALLRASVFKANCALRVDDRSGLLTLTPLVDVAAGEELLIHYGREWWTERLLSLVFLAVEDADMQHVRWIEALAGPGAGASGGGGGDDYDDAELISEYDRLAATDVSCPFPHLVPRQRPRRKTSAKSDARRRWKNGKKKKRNNNNNSNREKLVIMAGEEGKTDGREHTAGAGAPNNATPSNGSDDKGSDGDSRTEQQHQQQRPMEWYLYNIATRAEATEAETLVAAVRRSCQHESFYLSLVAPVSGDVNADGKRGGRDARNGAAGIQHHLKDTTTISDNDEASCGAASAKLRDDSNNNNSNNDINNINNISNDDNRRDDGGAELTLPDPESLPRVTVFDPLKPDENISLKRVRRALLFSLLYPDATLPPLSPHEPEGANGDDDGDYDDANDDDEGFSI